MRATTSLDNLLRRLFLFDRLESLFQTARHKVENHCAELDLQEYNALPVISPDGNMYGKPRSATLVVDFGNQAVDLINLTPI